MKTSEPENITVLKWKWSFYLSWANMSMTVIMYQ